MADDLENKLGELAVFPARNVLVASGTQTFAGVDIRDYTGRIKCVFSAFSPHAAATNELIVDILDSADNSTFAANTFATPVTTTASAVTDTITVDTRITKRYIQGRVRITGTTSSYAVAMIGVGQKQVV